jgi:hypothetical protein
MGHIVWAGARNDRRYVLTGYKDVEECDIAGVKGRGVFRVLLRGEV